MRKHFLTEIDLMEVNEFRRSKLNNSGLTCRTINSYSTCLTKQHLNQRDDFDDSYSNRDFWICDVALSLKPKYLTKNKILIPDT